MNDTPDRDRLSSIEDGPEVEQTVKGSRFLAAAFRADTEGAALSRIEGVRRKYHDATHHCWGFRLEDLERWNDDGEPSGTAGVPIATALRRAERIDALIVVTRWFGGTKLGTGGLARAYGDAAREALAAAPERTVLRLARFRIGFGYETLGAVEAALARFGDAVVAVERAFSPGPEFTVEILASRAGSFAEALRDATAGRASVEAAGYSRR